MRHRKRAINGMSIALIALATGCSSFRAEHSGFLNHYAQLTPDPKRDNLYVFENPEVGFEQYGRFLIDQVEVRFAPNARGTEMDQAKLDELADYARRQFEDALAERYEVVNQAGSGVAQIRFALTDFNRTHPTMNIHPASKLTGIGLGGASMELEAIDSETGERIVAIVETRLGNRLSIAPGLSQYGHARQVIRQWADRFVARINAAHARAVEADQQP